MNQRTSSTLPHWGSPFTLGLVVLGGMLGAGAREAVTLVFPTMLAVPVTIAVANTTGAFLIGVVYVLLSGRQYQRTARLRAFLATGVLGGYTTYSALALGVFGLLHEGELWLALAYGVGSLFFGVLATLAGIALGLRLSRGRGTASAATAASPPSAADRTDRAAEQHRARGTQ